MPHAKRPLSLFGGLWLAAVALAGCRAHVAPPPPPALEVSRVAAAYAEWSFEDAQTCGIDLARCAEQFGRRAGYQETANVPSPRRGANPDPEWLPGWDTLPIEDAASSQVFEALVLAKSRRAQDERCRRESAEREQRHAQDRARLDALGRSFGRETGLGTRLPALLSLRESIRKSSPEPFGVRDDLEQTIGNTLAERGLSEVAPLVLGTDTGPLRSSLSPQEEALHHCAAWSWPWPITASVATGAVKVPSYVRDREELFRKIEPLWRSTSTIKTCVWNEREVDGGCPGVGLLSSTAFGIELHVERAELGELVLRGSRTVEVPTQCKEASKPSRVGEDGTIHYDRDCTLKKETRVFTARLTLAEPAPIALLPGDSLTIVIVRPTLKVDGANFALEAEAPLILRVVRARHPVWELGSPPR